MQRVFVRDYPRRQPRRPRARQRRRGLRRRAEEKRYKGLEPGDEVGKGGVEYTYDRYLRGEPGLTRIQVNALGQPTPGGQLVSQPPAPGDNLKLTIDPDVQAAGEAALASYGLPGAFVSMNVNNGEILGMGSSPTFDPTVFTEPMTQAQVRRTLSDDPNAAPLTNRATESHYPTGSTFKIITALAALEGGVITPSTTIFDNGSIEVGGQRFQNAGGAAYGPVDLVRALQVSSDVYFYELGLRMWDSNRAAGLGRTSWGSASRPGSTCRSTTEGLVPSKEVARPALRRRRNRPALVGRRQHPAGDRPGRPADQPAADGDRLRGARPTAARSSPRTWAWKSRTRPAGC